MIKKMETNLGKIYNSIEYIVEHDRIIKVPKQFIDITGDTTSAAVLYELFMLTNATEDNGWMLEERYPFCDEDLWIPKSEIEKAKEKLMNLGIIEHGKRIINGKEKALFRINLAIVLKSLLNREKIEE